MIEPLRLAPWPRASHWSEVVAACRPDSPDNPRALDALCRTFRDPVYSYLRRDGHGHDEAQDLTQEFFLFLMAESRPLEGYDRARSRFRTFLLAVLKNFLRGRRRHSNAQKRGGDARPSRSTATRRSRPTWPARRRRPTRTTRGPGPMPCSAAWSPP